MPRVLHKNARKRVQACGLFTANLRIYRILFSCWSIICEKALFHPSIRCEGGATTANSFRKPSRFCAEFSVPGIEEDVADAISAMNETARTIEDYAVDTEFPQISGFEILEMLDLRSEIAEREKSLSETERRRLEEADRRFLHHAHEFYASVSKVVDLAEERQRNNVPPSHWWWYLEELVRARVA